MISVKLKLLCLYLAFLFIFSFSYAVDTYEICDEIEALKEADTYIKTRLSLEDENIKDMLDEIQLAKFAANSTEGKWLKRFFLNHFPIQQIVKVFTDKGIIGVDEIQAPRLHSMVKEISDELKVPKPFIFIVFDEKLFNAATISISTDASLIFIGEKLLNDLNDEQLRAVLAHELGHIYHNHVPKRLLYTSSMVANSCLLGALVGMLTLNKFCTKSFNRKLLTFAGASLLLEVLAFYMMPKFFRAQEKEADDIARKLVGAEIFSDAMLVLKNYTLAKQDDFEKACEFLDENIQDLENISPSRASQIKETAKLYLDDVENLYQNAIKNGSDTHPAYDERIGVVEEKVV